MKRSTAVTLSLLGIAGAATIGDNLTRNPEMRRNFYADRAACERDYTPAQCEASGSTSYNNVTYYHGWYGPSYAVNRGSAAAGDPGPGRIGGIATAVHSASSVSGRGGFGGTAHAASS